MVLVEGGPKAIRKFKTLMLKRINWKSKSGDSNDNGDEGAESSDDDDKEKADNAKEANNNCVLVWEVTRNDRVGKGSLLFLREP
jgi:hypothetical protein